MLGDSDNVDQVTVVSCSHRREEVSRTDALCGREVGWVQVTGSADAERAISVRDPEWV